MEKCLRKHSFFVLGASGMVGHTIAIYLAEQGHIVKTFTRRPFPYCDNTTGDVLDKDLFKSILQEDNYDFVINCVGILNNNCDEDTANAIYINSYFPHMVATILRESKTKVVHISTDCVFKGDIGPYYEDSAKDGDSLYAKTKALGELNDTKNLTIRSSIIGPDLKKSGSGLINWFMNQKNPIHGYKRTIWSGVSSLTLAKSIECIAENNPTGIYHLVNNDFISKYEMLQLLNKELRNNELMIIPSETPVLNRTLATSRNDFILDLPKYYQMVVDMGFWIKNHKDLYMHYFDD